MQAPNIIAQVLERMMPVGSIVEWAPVDGGDTDLSTPAKVAAYYGFGTWEAYGQGRVLLGESGSHDVGSTGGEEKHVLTASELPSKAYYLYYWTSRNLTSLYQEGYDGSIAGFTNTGGTQYAGNVEGGDQPHNNMPPYITVYRWRRIA